MRVMEEEVISCVDTRLEVGSDHRADGQMTI